MVCKEEAIVLKNHMHNEQGLWLITPSLGKVEVHSSGIEKKSIMLRPGVHFFAEFEKKRQHWRMRSVDTIVSSMHYELEQYYWQHHILELYYFFIEQGFTDALLFENLVVHLSLIKQNNAYNFLLGSLCVIDFLLQTGFYASDVLTYYHQYFAQVYQLYKTGSPSMIATVLDQIKTQEKVLLQKVITSCLQQHPQYSRFKTIAFVYKS